MAQWKIACKPKNPDFTPWQMFTVEASSIEEAMVKANALVDADKCITMCRLADVDKIYAVDPDLVDATQEYLTTTLRDTRQAIRNHKEGFLSNALLYKATLPEDK